MAKTDRHHIDPEVGEISAGLVFTAIYLGKCSFLKFYLMHDVFSCCFGNSFTL